ncbi:MAG: DUF1501 domain-containing protein [Ilumatobacteraceae bacterium]
MLDPDISTEDALALLSTPADAFDDGPRGPFGLTRRGFLQAVGMGVLGGAAVGTLGDGLLRDLPDTWAAPIGPNDGIVVVVTFYGGNDGLNTFVPYADGNYYSKRANIAIPQDQVLHVDPYVGFAPQLGYLKSLYDAGQVAAIQGVGYAGPDLSHFTSMAIWMNGQFGNGPLSTGWIGRWLDGLPAGVADLAAVSLDSSVPLHMQGFVRRAAGIPPNGGMFGVDSGVSDVRMYNGLRALAAGAGRGEMHDAFTSTMVRQLDLATQVAPAFKAALPSGGDLTRKLTIAARLINANLGLRVIDLSRGGFDTHENQNAPLTSGLQDLNAGLQAFYATLNPAFNSRVILVTVSEFGRTVKSNDSGGTDHGTSNTSFVIGSNVRGGLYGAMPSLSTLDRNGRMISNVDFRWIYGTLLDGWLGGGGSTILNGAYQNLGFLAGGPGSTPANSTPIVLGPSVASGFVSLAPLRMFDTRDGRGGRLGAIQQGEEWVFPIAGQYGVPAEATAVALNLTAVNATAPTYVTVWPGGTQRPLASNLNPVPGMAVPNLVVTQLGPGGSIGMFNNSGGVDLVGDLVGYFTASSSLRLKALTPARLLDTRDGTGGTLGQLGPGQSLTLKVNGEGGVPTNAKAVALNVTVTEPSDGSFLTVWPSGEARPEASSVNMVPGQTVPNMVLARVADGRIDIYNNTGATHVIVDVIGAFADNASGRFVAIQPGRVLDTRDGTGAPVGRVAQDPVVLKVTGVKGVPTSNVSAVLMNVIAVEPVGDSFVTVYPAGADRPLASNLNVVNGKTIPNMVLARVGTEGNVVLHNNTGHVDLVADVMGYFTG